MQSFTILGLAILLAFTSVYFYQSNTISQTPEQELEAQIFKRRVQDFQQFKKVNHKEYQNKNEESYRLSIFIQNEEEIEQYNMSHSDVVLKINEFTDLTKEEFKATHLGIQIDLDQVQEEFTHPLLQQAHDDINNSNKLTASKSVNYKHLNNGIVRRQVCGDCWANAAALVTEMHFSTNKLSTQDLINCDTYANGCDGSPSIHNNLYHIIANGILPYNQQPYRGKVLDCIDNKQYKKNYPPVGTQIASFAQFYNPDCNKLKALIATFGPATVTLYAEQSVHWSNYYSGILSHDDDEDWIFHEKGFYNINHAVVLVGYTEDYWIIQNSWGTQWGESGFARIKMGNTFNICVNGAAYAHKTHTRAKAQDYQSSDFMEYK